MGRLSSTVYLSNQKAHSFAHDALSTITLFIFRISSPGSPLKYYYNLFIKRDFLFRRWPCRGFSIKKNKHVPIKKSESDPFRLPLEPIEDAILLYIVRLKNRRSWGSLTQRCCSETSVTDVEFCVTTEKKTSPFLSRHIQQELFVGLTGRNAELHNISFPGLLQWAVKLIHPIIFLQEAAGFFFFVRALYLARLTYMFAHYFSNSFVHKPVLNSFTK